MGCIVCVCLSALLFVNVNAVQASKSLLGWLSVRLGRSVDADTSLSALIYLVLQLPESLSIYKTLVYIQRWFVQYPAVQLRRGWSLLGSETDLVLARCVRLAFYLC